MFSLVFAPKMQKCDFNIQSMLVALTANGGGGGRAGGRGGGGGGRAGGRGGVGWGVGGPWRAPGPLYTTWTAAAPVRCGCLHATGGVVTGCGDCGQEKHGCGGTGEGGPRRQKT
jgi:hypothetical protein